MNKIREQKDEKQKYEIELGIPTVIASLQNAIFEGLPNNEAQAWLERFLSAIRPGADLRLVWNEFAVFLLDYMLPYLSDNEAAVVANRLVRKLHLQMLAGDKPAEAEWAATYNTAKAAAYNIAKAAAYNTADKAAAYAAASASDNAAASASDNANAAAGAAAWNAAYAVTWDVIQDTAHDPDGFAAFDAAWDATYAAAWAAAGAPAWLTMADKLVELLAAAK